MMLSATGLIAVFAVLWMLQIAGTAWQMRHYRQVLAGVTTRWRAGTVGVGNAKSRLGKGLILILVVAPDQTLLEALAMSGRTIFAKFRAVTVLQGLPISRLQEIAESAGLEPGYKRAIASALDQVDRIQAETISKAHA